MWEEIIAKAMIPVMVSIAIKHLYDVFSNRVKSTAKLNEDYKFISTFLATDFKKRERLVVEQAFYAYFRCRYSYEAIVVLMRFPSPMKAFRLCEQAGKYLAVEDGRLKQVGSGVGLKGRLFVKVLIYFVFFSASCMPIIYATYILEAFGLYTFIQFFCMSLMIGAMAFDQLLESASIKASGRLLKEQAKLAD